MAPGVTEASSGRLKLTMTCLSSGTSAAPAAGLISITRRARGSPMSRAATIATARASTTSTAAASNRRAALASVEIRLIRARGRCDGGGADDGATAAIGVHHVPRPLHGNPAPGLGWRARRPDRKPDRLRVDGTALDDEARHQEPAFRQRGVAVDEPGDAHRLAGVT